jgi:CheY-like chemotaxis protein
MDGFELIAAIRSHPRDASLPVVVISGDSHPGLAERLLGLRVDAFFAKPYSPSAVRSKLEQLIFSSEATTARTGATEADRGPNRASHQSPSIVLPQPPERKAG